MSDTCEHEQDKDEELKTSSVRISTNVKQGLRDLLQQTGCKNQNELFENLINSYNAVQAKLEFVDRKTEISSFDFHIAEIQKAFTTSLQLNRDAEARVRNECATQLEEVQSVLNKNKELEKTLKDVQDEYKKLQDTQTTVEIVRKSYEENSNNLLNQIEVLKGENQRLQDIYSATNAELIVANNKLKVDEEQQKKAIETIKSEYNQSIEVIKSECNNSIQVFKAEHNSVIQELKRDLQTLRDAKDLAVKNQTAADTELKSLQKRFEEVSKKNEELIKEVIELKVKTQVSAQTDTKR